MYESQTLFFLKKVFSNSNLIRSGETNSEKISLTGCGVLSVCQRTGKKLGQCFFLILRRRHKWKGKILATISESSRNRIFMGIVMEPFHISNETGPPTQQQIKISFRLKWGDPRSADFFVTAAENLVFHEQNRVIIDAGPPLHHFCHKIKKQKRPADQCIFHFFCGEKGVGKRMNGNFDPLWLIFDGVVWQRGRESMDFFFYSSGSPAASYLYLYFPPGGGSPPLS